MIRFARQFSREHAHDWHVILDRSWSPYMYATTVYTFAIMRIWPSIQAGEIPGSQGFGITVAFTWKPGFSYATLVLGRSDRQYTLLPFVRIRWRLSLRNPQAQLAKTR